MSKPIRQWMRNQGWEHAWYVDDVLLVGTTKEMVERRAAELVALLTDLGIQVNCKKSMGQAAREFVYLGHKFDLMTGSISPLDDKVRGTLKMASRLGSGRRVQAKNVAQLAGNLLDATVKSNASLTGLPQQLMLEAGKIVNSHISHGLHCQAA